MTDNDKPKVSKIRSDVVLEDESPVADEGLVKSLEYLLEKAKAGEIKAVAFVDYWNHGGIGHGWDGVFDSPSQMLGEVEVLKYNFIVSSHGSAFIPVLEEE